MALLRACVLQKGLIAVDFNAGDDEPCTALIISFDFLKLSYCNRNLSSVRVYLYKTGQDMSVLQSTFMV